MSNAGEIEIVLPATSANLGPAFDAAALAMRLYLRVRAKQASEFAIRATGRDAAACGISRDNLILSTYREVCAKARANIVPLSIEIKNEIPIGKGCGSSSAARIAAILLANHFARLGWSDEEILSDAVAREGHADNCAACWFGGVVLTSGGPENLVVTRLKLQEERAWPLMVAVAPKPLPTRESRRVLPASYARADVVANVQNAMMLVAAFEQGRSELLARALEDRVHQPFREPLCPLLKALIPLAGHNGIHGVALSGAGPSVLLFLDRGASTEAISRTVCSHLEQSGLAAELLITEIETCPPPRISLRKLS